jgi:MFS family permease
MDRVTYTVPPAFDRYRQRALIVGVVAFLLSAALAFVGGPVQFFRSYLVAYVFWCGIAVGSLAIMMLHHLSGGAWGLVIRRIFEAATRTLPLLAVAFLPIAVSLFVHPGGHSLYEWSNPEAVKGDEVLQQKQLYLNAPFFLGRFVFYFLVWGALAYFLNKWSLEQDHTGDPRVKRRLQNLSGPGILLFGLTVTFAAVDWLMSLEPHWYSTIYGMLLMASWGLSAFAFVIVIAGMLAQHEPMSNVFASRHFHDYGKLMLAFVMLYAYFAFSQFLITWSGNLPEEIPWYLRRLRGGWQFVGLALVVLNFMLPFVLLLSRNLKRDARKLVWVALLVLLMRVVDMIYLVAPAIHQEENAPHINPLDFLTMFGATIGLGGIWLAYFAWQLKQRPLLPVQAPDLAEAVGEGAGHH